MIDYSVYLVTDQFNLNEDEFLNVIEEAVKGKTTMVQLREKDSDTREFYELALKVKAITDKYDVPLIINDRLDIAQAVGCAGVHLGQSDMPCTVAREILGDDKIIGISATTYDEAIQAQSDGADYLGVGGIYPTNTKKDAGISTHDDLLKIKEDINIPTVAIGGIKEDNAGEIVKRYGFDGVAVVSAIMLSENPKKTSENFSRIVKELE
ncbi:thiamine phosphate synthase [Methanosphaera sp. BMS]|uniref:thiamine phosphate synthase n=1 Tax=Methanosphaera sp. BMS TaxID=1789762 RepID=UPI000DC1E340|nr:thiamine phosphate synthase [Methanosphaera sp. BMS]AWX32204.1 thiamine-phosphate diphosphorylase [Methanosphaera sp. BMS]